MKNIAAYFFGLFTFAFSLNDALVIMATGASLIFPLLCVAQTQPETRQQLQNYTNTSIYQNPSHSITGQVLQNTFANYNSSCANLRTDTMFVMLFDSAITYYFGMKVLIPSSFLLNIRKPPKLSFARSSNAIYSNQVDTVNPDTLISVADTIIYKGITRCDTLQYKGPFDTTHFKPLYGYWNIFLY
jgi:hypothetical protein